MAQKGHAQRHFLDGHPDANAPGEHELLAGCLGQEAMVAGKA